MGELTLTVLERELNALHKLSGDLTREVEALRERVKVLEAREAARMVGVVHGMITSSPCSVPGCPVHDPLS